MRFNEKELAAFSQGIADKEGRLNHKHPGFRETYKERWFKLKGNLLFYFRLNDDGVIYESEPAGVLVIEQCRIQHEMYAELPNAFSITYADEIEKRHYFSCTSKRNCEEWVNILKESSCEYLRAKLLKVQGEIVKLTGKDPLASSSRKWPGRILSNDVESTASSRDRKNCKVSSMPSNMLLFNDDWFKESE